MNRLLSEEMNRMRRLAGIIRESAEGDSQEPVYLDAKGKRISDWDLENFENTWDVCDGIIKWRWLDNSGFEPMGSEQEMESVSWKNLPEEAKRKLIVRGRDGMRG